jgi:DNA-directed RNA polymerase subunit omega
MINPLQNDDLIRKSGGRFKLTALIQKRWLELMQGSRPLVDPSGKTTMEVVIDEIVNDKIAIDFEASGLDRPA